MTLYRLFFISVLLTPLFFGATGAVTAQDTFDPVACSKLVPGEPGHVAYVDDGDTVTLRDGRRVRLVGLQAPKLPLGRKGFKAWPLGEESRNALIALLQDKDVALAYGGRQQDRYGRELAHLFRLEDNLWVQGSMIEQGMARVYSFPDNRSCIADLLAREQAARAAQRGIWALDYYAIRSADRLPGSPLTNTFQLVEGRVQQVARVRDRIYINFGEDYRTDFTIVAERSHRKQLQEDGFPFDTLEKQNIRIRGWLYERNGPMIKLTHPEQMEFLDE